MRATACGGILIDFADAPPKPLQFFFEPGDRRAPVLRLRSLDYTLYFPNRALDLPQSLPFTGKNRDGERLINLLSEDHSRADAKGRHRILLETYGYRWFRVGGLDYLLRRSEA